MKQPSSHMRRGDFSGKTESSAVAGTLGLEYLYPLNKTDKPGANLVSDRFKKRRASGQSVKFTLPKKSNDRKSSKKNLAGLIADDDEDEEEAFSRFDLEYRRMSAPELPPINSSGKNSVLLNDGFLATRSSAFHNNKLNLESRWYRKSIHSDSSINGYRLNSQSRTSSSSSKTSRSRVQSAGTDGRKQPEITIAQPSAAPKLIPPTMKNGISATTPRCGSVTNIKWTKSKTSLNNPQRKIKHVQSESVLTARAHDTKQSNSLKRNTSDMSLTETKKNFKNSQTTTNGRRKLTANGNLNGMRRFSSTIGLSSEERKSEDDLSVANDDYDSGSDSEKDRRVIDWIIGVSDVAEPPEEPEIVYTDEPPQRDTAIRIVYEGES